MMLNCPSNLLFGLSWAVCYAEAASSHGLPQAFFVLGMSMLQPCRCGQFPASVIPDLFLSFVLFLYRMCGLLKLEELLGELLNLNPVQSIQ